MKYERLFLDDIPNALTLSERAEDYRLEYNDIRPHEAISFNRPMEVHLGLADPTIPNLEIKENLPTTNYLTRDRTTTFWWAFVGTSQTLVSREER